MDPASILVSPGCSSFSLLWYAYSFTIASKKWKYKIKSTDWREEWKNISKISELLNKKWCQKSLSRKWSETWTVPGGISNVHYLLLLFPRCLLMGAAGGSKWVKHWFCNGKTGCPAILKTSSDTLIRVLHLFESSLFIIIIVNSITEGIIKTSRSVLIFFFKETEVCWDGKITMSSYWRACCTLYILHCASGSIYVNGND